MKFSIKDFFSICDQIRSFLRTWSRLLNKSLMENFIFCAEHELVRWCSCKCLQHSTSSLTSFCIYCILGTRFNNLQVLNIHIPENIKNTETVQNSKTFSNHITQKNSFKCFYAAFWCLKNALKLLLTLGWMIETETWYLYSEDVCE